MQIPLSEIMSVPNKIESFEIPIEFTKFSVQGETYEFAEKPPIKLTITNLGKKKVKVEGGADYRLMVPCSRCLEPVLVPITIKILIELDCNKKEEERVLDEMNYLSGYNLDIDRLVYEELLIHFPTKVLCREECKGICRVCGVNRNKQACTCETEPLDPRMAAIQDIFNNFKEV